ncbi:MAG TPA: hypothetical protein VE544_04465 [Nitrososphaeraceae archaeon]|nr:hypothetical protein [Nitrososphaeraceae archaeon]
MKYKKPERRDYFDDFTYEDDAFRYAQGFEPLGPHVKRAYAPEDEAAISSLRAEEASSADASPPPIGIVLTPWRTPQQVRQQQRPPQQQKIRRSDGSWFYYSSSTYVMPVEDTTGSSSDNTSNNNNDTTTEVDTVEGDYEF